MPISPEHDHRRRSPRHLDPLAPGQDRKRDEEEIRHHPATHLQPHPPHHPQYQVTGEKKHLPHSQPEDFALNVDHGTHEDRPRPGKIAKKGRNPESFSGRR